MTSNNDQNIGKKQVLSCSLKEDFPKSASDMSNKFCDHGIIKCQIVAHPTHPYSPIRRSEALLYFYMAVSHLCVAVHRLCQTKVC